MRPNPSEQGGKWQALNPAIYLISVIPAAMVLVLPGAEIAPWALATLGVIAIQHAVNVFNDCVDWRGGADLSKDVSWVRFHKDSVRTTAWHAGVSLVIGLGLGGLACAVNGRWDLLAWSVPFVGLGLLYNTHFAYQGWGEWVTALCYGAVPVFLGLVSNVPPGGVLWVVGAGTGALALSVLVSHQLPQEFSDAVAGKLSLVVRRGPRVGRWVSRGGYGVFLCCLSALVLTQTRSWGFGVMVLVLGLSLFPSARPDQVLKRGSLAVGTGGVALAMGGGGL